MNKYIKSLLKIYIFASVILTGTSAYAATSDALIEMSLTNSALAQHGSAYDAPFIVPDSSVDTATGAVVIKEADVSLPGKNGFDLNIYREYSSFNTNYKYIYKVYDTKTEEANALGVPYRATGKNVDKLIYVRYDDESDIVEGGYTTLDAINDLYKDVDGTKYLMDSMIESSGEVKLTLDRDTEPIYLYKGITDAYTRKVRSSNNIQIGNGWYISMPYMTETKAYTIAEGNSYYKDRYYAELGLDDGEKVILRYTHRHQYKTNDEPNADIWRRMYLN